MKEAIVHKGIKVEIVDSPIPEPNPDQVVIHIHYSGMNPKDWKMVEWIPDKPHNTGDDIAGTIHSVGSNVTEFKVGDRVAAFHEMTKPHGSFAEYGVAYAHTTFHLPKNTSFEEGATIPLAAMTAAIGLFLRLGLPHPWTPAKSPIPLIVYGAASAVGAFTVKLAGQANIHPMFCVAGRGTDFVKSLPGFDASKGDVVVDYRGDVEAALKEAIKKAGVAKVEYAFDATSEHDSDKHLVAVLDPKASITTVLPGKEHPVIPSTMNNTLTSVGSSFKEDKDFANVFYRHFARGLGQGTFSGHPYESRKGLESVEGGLKDLQAGKASAVKYVFSVQDTQGAGKA